MGSIFSINSGEASPVQDSHAYRPFTASSDFSSRFSVFANGRRQLRLLRLRNTNGNRMVIDSSNVQNNLQSSSEPFTPKILSGINAHNILLGRESYDSFFSNCCLENHLHMFGTLDLTNGNSSIQSGQPNYEELEDEVWHLQPEEHSVPTVSCNYHETGPTFTSDESVSTGSLYRSTISDVTRFYNSCNLSGPAFDPEEAVPEPPPYSDLPYDPPPPYSECEFSFHAPQHAEGGRHYSDPLSESLISRQNILW
ncbi:hypothetical protein PoB_006984700 [Plakobranchus ocellatus]|uniref:Uncharacterized protein n=1 Tax=Plakobranchus ocellatus TaxID=259542 RepID=A0AAV4DH78_9GAST|nr:hypothetical protein PoB_006984700 [Plakobranchus ocellatus]